METEAIQTKPIEAEQVEYTVRAHLAAFGRGDFDAWGAAFARDIFFTAAGPEEVFWTREDAVAEMHKDFDPAFDEGLQIEVEPLSFHAGVSADGASAWSAAPLEYGINFQGETSSFVLRHTSLLTKLNRGWSIAVTQYSLALPEAKVLRALTVGSLPAPHPIGYDFGAGAQALVGSFKSQLADFSMSAISRDAHVFGPFPGEEAEGETAVRALFSSWTSKWGGLRLRPDGIRAEFISETMGWVAANVDAVLSYEDHRAVVPLRALVVYQKEQDHWVIVHAHLSVGIPDELAE
jgi:ketosteroid isomerase-like protein